MMCKSIDWNSAQPGGHTACCVFDRDFDRFQKTTPSIAIARTGTRKKTPRKAIAKIATLESEFRGGRVVKVAGSRKVPKPLAESSTAGRLASREKVAWGGDSFDGEISVSGPIGARVSEKIGVASCCREIW